MSRPPPSSSPFALDADLRGRFGNDAVITPPAARRVGAGDAVDVRLID